MSCDTAATEEAIRAAIASDEQLSKRISRIQVSARRRTLGMAMSPGDDGITLQVPADATPADILRALSKSRDRIGAMLLKARACAPDHPVKRMVGGEGFLWLGRSKRLRLVDDALQPVRSVDDYGHVTNLGRWLEVDRTALRHGAKPVVDWYSREGTVWLQEQVRRIWPRMTFDRPMPAVTAGNIGRSRRGKHTARADVDEIVIAWQTFQLSPKLVRHVLNHELTHASRPGGKAHGPEFWRAFERAEIGASQTARLVNEEGRHIWMGDILQ